MLADVMGSAGRIDLHRKGNFGELPAEVATALVLVITELVQNALEHAFPNEASGTVTVRAERSRGQLELRVDDDGVGLPEGFSESSGELGLQIVRTLVAGELDGTVALQAREPGPGTSAVVLMPMARRARVGG